MSDNPVDINFMRLAIKEAHKAFAAGEVPVGAVIVIDGEIAAAAYNQRESTNDPTAHAETIAMRTAAQKIGNWRLTGATVYVTKEPCVMCSGVMVNARLGRLVYGCRDLKGGAVSSLYALLSDKRLNHQVEVISGVLENECSELLKRFFQERR